MILKNTVYYNEAFLPQKGDIAVENEILAQVGALRQAVELTFPAARWCPGLSIFIRMAQWAATPVMQGKNRLQECRGFWRTTA